MTVESAALVRFVSSPDAGRDVRLALSEGQRGSPPVKTLREGTDLGAPPLERTIVAPADRDGDVVTGSRYGSRTLTLNLRVYGDGWVFSSAMAALARELDRERNWLEFKPPGVNDAVFFHTFRTDISRLDLANAGAGNDKWDIEVAILAEPFGVGLPVLGSASVSNNPAAAGNPQTLTLPTIKGDVPAPLNVTASDTALASGGATALLGVHTNPGVSGRILLQGESASPGADTTVQANSAVMSGAGSNYMRCTFATAEFMFDRVSWSSLSVTFGTYRMLARVRKTAASNEFTIRRRLTSIGGTEFFGPTRVYPATTNAGPHWVDLGVLDLPAGPVPPGVTSGIVGHLGVQAARTSGSGSLDFDAVVLVPDKAGVIGQPETGLATVWHQWGSSLLEVGFNAEDDQVWTATGSNYGHSPTRRAGSLPQVRPGYTNHLTFMRHVGTLGGGTNKDTVSADDIAWTSTIDWSYRPRYLYVSAPA